jgi:nicotinamide mononucleotide transporter
MSAYGWWLWSRAPREARVVTEVGFSAWRSMALTLSATIVLSLGLGHGMTRVHLHWPALFPEPASLPYLDATTTTMSFTAMWLMARRRTESWVYWIVVDVLGIGIYYVKDVRFVALLYLVLLGLATRGLLGWVSSESDR